MKKVLYFFIFTYYFLFNQIHLGNGNFRIVKQNMFINGSKLEPLHLLPNDSIYPFRIIQIGGIFDQIKIFFLNKSYCRYIVKKNLDEYKKSKNFNKLVNELNKINKNIKKNFLAKFGYQAPLYRFGKIKKTIEQIKEYFQSYGFLNVNIKCKISINKKTRQVIVSFFIEAGEKYKISDIEIICENENLKKILDLYYIKPSLKIGQNINFNKIEQEIEKILNIFRNNGFLFFKESLINFYLCKTYNKKQADVVIKIEDDVIDCDKQFTYNETSCKYLYKNKKYEGNTSYNIIKKNIINNFIVFPRGRLYSKQYENKFYEYLYNTNIFKNINLEKSLDQYKINTEVFLNINKRVSYLCNPNFSFNSENVFFNFNNKLKILNMCKILDTTNIKLEIEGILIDFANNYEYFKNPQITFSPEFSYPFSFIFKNLKNKIATKYVIKIKYDYEEKEKKNQNLFLISFFIQYTLDITKKINISLIAYFFEWLRYKEHSEKKNNINPHLKLLFSYSPNDNFATNIESDVGVNKFYNGNFNTYFKISFEQIFKIYFNYHNGINMRLKIGKIFSKKNEFPDTIYFKIGGNKSLRGWDINDVGPGSAQYVDEYDKKGEILLLYNIEYNYRFNEVFSILCPFFDIGNVYEKKLSGAAEYSEKDFSIKDFYKKLHVNTGFAIRITWKIFVIRFDIGFRIYEPTKIPVWGKRYFSFTPNVNFCFGLPF